jgi:hypothetical protein
MRHYHRIRPHPYNKETPERREMALYWKAVVWEFSYLGLFWHLSLLYFPEMYSLSFLITSKNF